MQEAEEQQRGDGDYRFEGLDGVHGTLFPDVLLDRVMANLTGAEFKVLAYIVRRTIGLKREADTISLEQICNGVKGRDGAIVDGGTGLSKKTAIAALKGLQDKGVIVAHKRTSRERGNLPSAFALRFKERDEADSAPAPLPSLTPASPTLV